MNYQSRFKERAFYYQLGSFIDVGLLRDNHHKINLIASEDLLLNEGIVPLMWINSFTASLSR